MYRLMDIKVKGLIMKKISVILFTLLIVSCASIPPKAITGEISSKIEPIELSFYLEKQAQKCWGREWGWFGDGVIIDTRIDFRGRVIEALRYAPDIGLRPAFIELVVVQSGTGSEVSVVEGGRFNILSEVSMVPEVRQWINGNQECITEK